MIYRDRDRIADMWVLADAFFNHLIRDNCEYGGWGLDDKRPFGNSNVEGDILEMLGLDTKLCDHCGEIPDQEEARAQREYARALYADLGAFLTKAWKDLWSSHPTDPADDILTARSR